MGFLFALFSLESFAQFELVAKHKLSDELHEISGLVALSPTDLFAINDGGNEACLYHLSSEGKIRKKYYLDKAVNVDWEALALDPFTNTVYVGDIGNNSKKRRQLTIYEVVCKPHFQLDTLPTRAIQIDISSWPNDYETLVWNNNQLHLYSKIERGRKHHNDPFTVLTIDPKTGEITSTQTEQPYHKRFLRHSFTDGTMYRSIQEIILLSYRGFWLFDGESFTKMKINQYEAIGSFGNSIFIACENHWLFGKQKLWHYREK